MSTVFPTILEKYFWRRCNPYTASFLAYSLLRYPSGNYKVLTNFAVLPPWLVLDPLLHAWLLEDLGRGDRTTSGLLAPDATFKTAKWIAKAPGIIAGLPVAARVFQLLNEKVSFAAVATEGAMCEPGQLVAEIDGSLDALLSGERVALNLAMRLSGISTLTNIYVDKIADFPALLVDTRKTMPGDNS